MFWNITTIHHHHIFGKMFYCFACAATIGSFTNSCKHVYNFPSSVQNIKTRKSENIWAWNTSEHYFVNLHKTKRFHREKKQFKVQRRTWKKIGRDKQYYLWLCSPNQNRITDHTKYSEQIKFPKFWKNYISIFLFVDIFFLAVTEKKPLQNHITYISLIIWVGCYSSTVSLLRVSTISCLHPEFHYNLQRKKLGLKNCSS